MIYIFIAHLKECNIEKYTPLLSDILRYCISFVIIYKQQPQQIKTMKKTKKLILNPVKYLLPKNTANTESPIGIIIPFQIVEPFRVAILLFYDYRTGRIERYVVNAETKFSNWKPVNHGLNNTFVFDKKPYIINYAAQHSIPDFTNLYIPYLNTGKMSLKFYSQFKMELLRDYIYSVFHDKSAASYNHTNIDIIRALTRPSVLTDKMRGNVGSGDMAEVDQLLIHHTNNFKLDNVLPFSAQHFFETNYKLKLIIHIPKRFQNIIEDKLGRIHFNVLPIKDYSQGVIDLKRSLEIRTFNYNVTFQLSKHHDKLHKNGSLLSY